MLKSTLYLLLPSLVAGAYIPHAKPICRDFNLHVNAAAQNWDLPAYPNDTDVKTLVRYLTKTIPESGFAQKPKRTVSGIFKIAATYCEPVNRVAEREGTIQLLLHGFGYSRVSYYPCCHRNFSK